jgi:para-nitrobenzyl esterase
VCPQVIANDVAGDEDCLTLNVWTPRERPRTPLPVMVYLTGGGNHSQSGQGSANVNFSGSQLVPKGVVFVTANIRLGVFGFLAHPALDLERQEHVSGNYGNQDHIAMLRWLKVNIGAFGGDPTHIFLFGTSAGGANICGLMTSPLARTLFHGAAMESSVPTGCEFQTLAQAESRTGARLVKAVRCDTARELKGSIRALGGESNG